MAYLNQIEFGRFGFKALGRHVKIGDKACIYNADQMEIGDYSRIGDFCIISGRVKIGLFNHIIPMCLMAEGAPGIIFKDFCNSEYGVKIFPPSDDYSGETVTNSLIPNRYTKELFAAVHLQKRVIVVAETTILPGVAVRVGCSVGAMSVLTKSTAA
ncbi:acyltransferase [Pseudomonas lurida]|jgi:acetyltransferase-like isoleucine patch superfamily enzyme|uniref:acyltransferase n=1 Tax=Pseudomonas lurida TaxID=244566 RepID=UPI001EE16895|nr:acyltransferase [Pseudomonas lurida]